MRSDRLIAIMLLLQTRGQLPAAELAARLEVSVRTIMRDVEALSAAGVPVYTVRGPLGGVALVPGYRTDVTGLTAEESRALLVLLTGPARAGLGLGLGDAIGSALRKLVAALPDQQRPGAELASRRILIDPVRWRGSAQPGECLEVLQEASFSGRRVKLRYRHGRDGSVRTYTLDPYGLVSKAGVWYLAADHRGEPHLFRADRILAATLLDSPARLRDGVELADVWEDLRREIEDFPGQFPATVRVRREILGRFLLLHESDLAEPPPAGGDDSDHVDLRLRFRAPAAAQMLLAFGTDVAVIDPPELRERLASVATAIAASYKAPRSC
jgi:predicted DNA-binding transcriptional regulator YafY